MLTLPEFGITAGGAIGEDGVPIQVTIWLTEASDQQISVDVEIGVLDLVANRMATPGADYYLSGAPSGVFSTNITFAPYETGCAIVIGLIDDVEYEGEEWLSIRLSNPVNALLGEDYDSYTADIIDDVEDPYIVVTDVETIEPLAPGEPAYASFHVEMMGGTGGQTSEVTWMTTVGPSHTATSGSDFTAGSGTVTAGGWYNEILVPIVYDGSGEAAESFGINLTSATGGITILTPSATATILDAPAIPAQPPPPDGQHGPEVGRTLTGLSAAPGGGLYWEGDEVTFTASLSAGPPGSNETFVWEYRKLAAVWDNGGGTPHPEYWGWQIISGGTTANVAVTSNDPLIGQIRVKLISGDTVSSQTMDVRWQAAYPVNFRLTTPAPHLDHRRLAVTYAWSSSSGRMEDLDGVNMGEFVWMTANGYWSGQKGTGPLPFTPPGPPFVGDQEDGKVVDLDAADVIAGALTDFHGGGYLSMPASKGYTVGQYYWYEITDGASYMAMVGGHWGRASGDPRGKQVITGSHGVIAYRVRPYGLAPLFWEYEIKKVTWGLQEISETQVIHKDEFPWDCDTSS